MRVSVRWFNHIPRKKILIQFAVLCAIAFLIVSTVHKSESSLSFAFGHSNSSAASVLNVTLRDSTSGRFISSEMVLRDTAGKTTRLSTESNGRGKFQVSAGEYEIEIGAAGYKPLRTRFSFVEASESAVTLWLDPIEPATELQAQNIRRKFQPGSAFLHGHVFDSDSGRPLNRVQIRLEKVNRSAETNDAGYFSLYAPLSQGASSETPSTDTLVAQRDGYTTYRRVNVLLMEGAAHFIIDMKRGTGINEKDTRSLARVLQTSRELVSDFPQNPSREHGFVVRHKLSHGFGIALRKFSQRPRQRLHNHVVAIRHQDTADL